MPQTIGVIGSGTMGGGIAYVAALSRFNVLLYDISSDILQKNLSRLKSDAQKAVEKGKLSPDQASLITANIHPRTLLQELSDCDVVIEAAIEDLKAKQEIFKTLGEVCRQDAILATNTSSLSVTAIASPTKNPERVVGMHFFNPAHIMKLVEVIQGNQTSDEVVQRTQSLAEQMGKTAVIAKDTPGFIVNRIARPFYGEALRILAEGVTTVEEIDRIVKLEGGFKMGPFELMDLIGIDVNFAVTKSMYEQTFGEPRYRPHPIQQQMVNAGRLGRKTKRGFYRYDTE